MSLVGGCLFDVTHRFASLSEKYFDNMLQFTWKKSRSLSGVDQGCTMKLTHSIDNKKAWPALASLKVGYIANFGQKSLFRVYNLVHQKEDLSKSNCWKFEESYIKFFEGKCAAKSSKPSRKARRGQDMPVCNSKSFALQWLIHRMDGSQYRQVLIKSMFTTTSCQR